MVIFSFIVTCLKFYRAVCVALCMGLREVFLNSYLVWHNFHVSDVDAVGSLRIIFLLLQQDLLFAALM